MFCITRNKKHTCIFQLVIECGEKLVSSLDTINCTTFPHCNLLGLCLRNGETINCVHVYGFVVTKESKDQLYIKDNCHIINLCMISRGFQPSVQSYLQVLVLVLGFLGKSQQSETLMVLSHAGFYVLKNGRYEHGHNGNTDNTIFLRPHDDKMYCFSYFWSEIWKIFLRKGLPPRFGNYFRTGNAVLFDLKTRTFRW